MSLDYQKITTCSFSHYFSRWIKPLIFRDVVAPWRPVSSQQMWKFHDYEKEIPLVNCFLFSDFRREGEAKDKIVFKCVVVVHEKLKECWERSTREFKKHYPMNKDRWWGLERNGIISYYRLIVGTCDGCVIYDRV